MRRYLAIAATLSLAGASTTQAWAKGTKPPPAAKGAPTPTMGGTVEPPHPATIAKPVFPTPAEPRTPRHGLRGGGSVRLGTRMRAHLELRRLAANSLNQWSSTSLLSMAASGAQRATKLWAGSETGTYA